LTMFFWSISTQTPVQIGGPKEKQSLMPRWYTFAKDLPTLSSGMEFQLRTASVRLYIRPFDQAEQMNKMCHKNRLIDAWVNKSVLGVCSHITPKLVPRGSTGYIYIYIYIYIYDEDSCDK
jgi:hypothetical protein